MKNTEKHIELYPGHWLYNAGVIGFLTILNSIEEDDVSNVINSGLSKNILKNLFNKQIGISFTPLINEKIPYWHWEYLSRTYRKYYGNINTLVSAVFHSASNTTNSTLKAQLKKKLIEKDKQYKKHNFLIRGKEIDFSEIYKHIDEEIWKNTFKRNPTLTVEDAIKLSSDKLEDFKNAIIYRRAIAFLFSTGCFYQNYYNPGWYGNADKFLGFFSPEKITKTIDIERKDFDTKCDFCGSHNLSMKKIDLMMFANLFPSYGNFPNSFWNMNLNQTQNICSLCEFFLLHQHLGFIKTSDNVEIFINAPSFEIMLNLNLMLKETSLLDSLDKKDLLAITIIEAVARRNLLIGKWAEMNIEIISQKNGIVDFFSLPTLVVKLLGNRRIALQLKEIGEFSVLNLLLNQKFNELVELAYRILKISMKNSNEGDKNFINNNLFLYRNKKDKKAQRLVANKILKLYALIEEQLKTN
jgi:hypothetical protein